MIAPIVVVWPDNRGFAGHFGASPFPAQCGGSNTGQGIPGTGPGDHIRNCTSDTASQASLRILPKAAASSWRTRSFDRLSSCQGFSQLRAVRNLRSRTIKAAPLVSALHRREQPIAPTSSSYYPQPVRPACALVIDQRIDPFATLASRDCVAFQGKTLDTEAPFITDVTASARTDPNLVEMIVRSWWRSKVSPRPELHAPNRAWTRRS